MGHKDSARDGEEDFRGVRQKTPHKIGSDGEHLWKTYVPLGTKQRGPMMAMTVVRDTCTGKSLPLPESIRLQDLQN